MSENNQQQDTYKEPENINIKQWTQNETGKVLGYCSRKGLGVSSFIEKKCAILPPFAAIWLMESPTNKEKFWLISGDLPLDHIPFSAAASAREAIRYFALNWQLKAERLMQSLAEGKPQLGDTEKQTEFATLLVRRADMLYDMAERETLWKNQQD